MKHAQVENGQHHISRTITHSATSAVKNDFPVASLTTLLIFLFLLWAKGPNMVKVKTHCIGLMPSVTHETGGVCNTSSIDHMSGCVSNGSGIKCSPCLSRGNSMDILLHNTIGERVLERDKFYHKKNKVILMIYTC